MEWKLAQEIDRNDKSRDPSPYRAPAKRTREESSKERNLKSRGSGERLDAMNRSKYRGTRDKSRDRSRGRGTRDKSSERSRERGARDRSRDRGTWYKSRESVDQGHLHGHTRQKLHAQYTQDRHQSRNKLRCAHTAASDTWQATHCVHTQMPSTTQQLNGRIKRSVHMNKYPNALHLYQNRVFGATAKMSVSPTRNRGTRPNKTLT